MNESTAYTAVAIRKWVNRFGLSVSNRGLDESTVRSAIQVKIQVFNEVTDQAWRCWDEFSANGCVVASSDPVLNSAKSSGNGALLPINSL